MVSEPKAWLEKWLETKNADQTDRVRAHIEARQADPDRYLELAAWYLDRDPDAPQRVLFLIGLFFLELEDERFEAMLAKGVKPGELSAALKDYKDAGFKPRRPLIRAVAGYLRGLEADPERFDRAVILAKPALKHLYASLHIQPGDRANSALFANLTPEGSRIGMAKSLARTSDPSMRAALIAEGGLTLAEVMVMIGAPCAACWVPIIENSSAAELRRDLRFLRDRGALDRAETRASIAVKLGGRRGLSEALREVDKPHGTEDHNLAGYDAESLLDLLETP